MILSIMIGIIRIMVIIIILGITDLIIIISIGIINHIIIIIMVVDITIIKHVIIIHQEEVLKPIGIIPTHKQEVLIIVDQQHKREVPIQNLRVLKHVLILKIDLYIQDHHQPEVRVDPHIVLLREVLIHIVDPQHQQADLHTVHLQEVQIHIPDLLHHIVVEVQEVPVGVDHHMEVDREVQVEAVLVVDQVHPQEVLVVQVVEEDNYILPYL